MAPHWDARRFVVEQTYYNDWYYGLRRLFQEGARPDVVVIVLTARQWIRDDTRGDYSAQYLMTVPDAAAASIALHMHPTQASSFVLASASRFWGARAEIRNFILGRAMPDLPALMNMSSAIYPGGIENARVEEIATARFERCRDLAAAYGAHVVALLPPVLEPDDGSPGLLRAGTRARVTVLVPVASGSYPETLYRDAGFHLNAAGARAFTDALARTLPVRLDQAAYNSARVDAASPPTTRAEGSE